MRRPIRTCWLGVALMSERCIWAPPLRLAPVALPSHLQLGVGAGPPPGSLVSLGHLALAASPERSVSSALTAVRASPSVRPATVVAGESPCKCCSLSESGYVLYLALFLSTIIAIYLSIMITGNYLSIAPVRKRINRLRASVMAYSGLSIAQAFVAGHEGHNLHWEAQGYTKAIDSVGGVTLWAVHDAGWLRVRAEGVYHRDTAMATGLLGNEPPPFCEDALTLTGHGRAVVVADRARVYGNIATPQGGVVTKGSGTFAGAWVRALPRRYDCADFDRQFVHMLQVFSERRSPQYWPDSLRTVMPEEFQSALAHTRGDIHVQGSLVLTDTLDLAARNLWIQGDLVVGERAQLRSLRANVTGDVVVGGMASLDEATVFACGDVRIKNDCRVQLNVLCAETLSVSDGAQVLYPSVLYLTAISPRPSCGGKVILIDGRARVAGTVMAGNLRGGAASVVIAGRSKVQGVVYTPGCVTLYGNIQGAVCAANVLYRLKRSVYEGWLMETSLKAADLSQVVVPLAFPDAVPKYLYVEQDKRRYTL